MKSILAALVVSACFALWQVGCASRNPQATENAATPEATPEAVAEQASEGERAVGNGQLPPRPDGSDAGALVEWGTEAYKKDHDAEAAEAFQQAVEMEPDYAEAHYKLGLAYHALGKNEDSEKSFEKAAKAYDKLADKNPKDASAHFYLGLAYAKLGEYEDAVKAYKQAVKLDEGDDEKFYELGVAHCKLAQYKEGIEAFEKALEINPDNFRAADAIERAKPGLARREAFLKQQEKQREEELRRLKGRGNTNGNANGNTNAGPVTTNAAPKPAPATTPPQSP